MGAIEESWLGDKCKTEEKDQKDQKEEGEGKGRPLDLDTMAMRGDG